MNLKYNWDNNLRVKLFLEKIYSNSQKELLISGYSEEYANEFINDIEDFLRCIIIYSCDFERIMDLLEPLEYIAFIDSLILYPDENSSFNTTIPVINFGSRILINSKLPKDSNLTARERRKMYLFHGLCNSILNFQNKDTFQFSHLYDNILPKPNTDISRLVNSGWLLLEETIAQEIAERFTYFVCGKNRPNNTFGGDIFEKDIIGSIKVESNLEYFRTFQSLVLRFALTVSGIGSIEEHSSVMLMHDLIKKTLNEEFSQSVIAQYIHYNNQEDLYKILYIMGILLNEKNSHMGISLFPELSLTKKEFQSLYKDLCDLLNRHITLTNEKYSYSGNYQDLPTGIYTKKRIMTLIKENKVDFPKL